MPRAESIRNVAFSLPDKIEYSVSPFSPLSWSVANTCLVAKLRLNSEFQNAISERKMLRYRHLFLVTFLLTALI